MAAGGREALELLNERRDYDAVVSDLIMPDLDGMELFRRIAAAHPDLARRFVFATGAAGRPEVADFLRSSGRPFLDKPFAPDDLLEIIRALLEGGG